MAVFPLLSSPATYRACDTDLLRDEPARSYWLDAFATILELQLDFVGQCGVPATAIDSVRTEMLGELAALRAQPDRHGRLDILLLDQVRGRILRRHGIVDEFAAVKRRENDAAMSQLRAVLNAIDELPPGLKLEQIIRMLLAGNFFDMGAKASASQFIQGVVPIDRAMSMVPARPWLIDHLDKAAAAWHAQTPRKAVLFADNAGADKVLGILPLARHMVQHGSTVVLAANSVPSLNDVTAAELSTLLQRASNIDSTFGGSRIKVIDSGNDAPLIDLEHVSHELADAAVDCDLVVLVGMGRAIESNFSARFTVPAWKVAMIKDPQVARTVGGRIFDAVFKFEAAWPQDV